MEDCPDTIILPLDAEGVTIGHEQGTLSRLKAHRTERFEPTLSVVR